MRQNKLILVSCVCIFAIFFVYVEAAQLHGPARGVNSTKNSSRIGICTLEVPTVDLLSPESRKGPIPRGNGTREGYSKIDVCCSGYTRVPHTHLKCEPECDGCENGNCTAPGVCVCKRGWLLDENKNCIPTCPIGCHNGVCTMNGECSCNAGNVLSTSRKYCVPHCTGGCGIGGRCTGPEICTCDPGFSVQRDNKCGYHCDGGCIDGVCVGPNQCQCKPNYKLSGHTCVPDCPRGCQNGKCVAPNKCACDPGWSLDASGTLCTAHCDRPCLNGDCVAPNKCACKKGYTEAPGTIGSEKCVAFCPGGCVNGVCSAPNFCICNAGYVKQAKGSNICVQRIRRSAMHMDLIPEDVLNGL